MRDFLQLILLLCMSVIFSCASIRQKQECKKEPFERLDSLQRFQKVLNYSVEIPKNWKKSKFSGGDWYYLEGEFIDSLNYHERFADVYIVSDKIKNNCNSEYSVKNYVKLFIDNKKKWWYKNFKYSLVKSIHKKYGEIYIMKYKQKRPHDILENGVFFIYYNRVGYMIHYKNKEKDFDKYISDVDLIVNSFVIQE